MSKSERPKVVAIIPARYKSVRFPGKVIALLAGRPLVAHTYSRTKQAERVDDVIVAIDDKRAKAALLPLGIPTRMTRPSHVSGTDRIAEVAEGLDADIVVNVQGDEPLIDPATIDAAVQALLDQPGIPMATARCRITEQHMVADPNVVKVVTDCNGRALYFSRHAIPYIREESDVAHAATCYWQHIGLYVFRRDFLLKYAAMKPTALEQLERLEQLRVLENGYPIAVIDTEYRSLGVDTPSDLDAVNVMMKNSAMKGPLNA